MVSYEVNIYMLVPRLCLHETGSVWNWYKIGTDKHCVYTGPGRPVLDRFSYPVPNRLTCESDPVWNLAVPKVVPRPCMDPIQMEPNRPDLFFVGSMEAPAKAFLLPVLAKVESSQKSNGMWFFRHFSRHIYSIVAETIVVTSYAASFGAKKCSENHI